MLRISFKYYDYNLMYTLPFIYSCFYLILYYKKCFMIMKNTTFLVFIYEKPFPSCRSIFVTDIYCRMFNIKSIKGRESEEHF